MILTPMSIDCLVSRDSPKPPVVSPKRQTSGLPTGEVQLSRVDQGEL